MATVCGKCKAYDAEGSVTTCSTCDLPMQFTLLPRNQGAAPPLPGGDAPPGLRRPGFAEQANGIMDKFGVLFRFRWVVTLVVLLGGGFFGAQFYDEKSQKERNDPFQIRSKFDEVQDKINHPEPVAGFQPAFQPGTQMYQPPQQAAFNNGNVPGVRVPQPPAPPPPMVNTRNFNARPPRP